MNIMNNVKCAWFDARVTLTPLARPKSCKKYFETGIAWKSIKKWNQWGMDGHSIMKTSGKKSNVHPRFTWEFWSIESMIFPQWWRHFRFETIHLRGLNTVYLFMTHLFMFSISYLWIINNSRSIKVKLMRLDPSNFRRKSYLTHVAL